LALADFYLFLQLKSALKEWHFCGATNIIKHVIEGLKKAFTKWLADMLPTLFSRW
jgi:hypothetical protein